MMFGSTMAIHMDEQRTRSVGLGSVSRVVSLEFGCALMRS